jgi:hypothetical protein
MAASEIGDGRVLADQDAPANARSPARVLACAWRAGQGSQVNELQRPLGAQPGGRDGAKVRGRDRARGSLRRRELADLEGQAGEKSQSMLLAQMLLAAAFLVFLMYPAVHLLLQA